jgi:hypothetical protein
MGQGDAHWVLRVLAGRVGGLVACGCSHRAASGALHMHHGTKSEHVFRARGTGIAHGRVISAIVSAHVNLGRRLAPARSPVARALGRHGRRAGVPRATHPRRATGPWPFNSLSPSRLDSPGVTERLARGLSPAGTRPAPLSLVPMQRRAQLRRPLPLTQGKQRRALFLPATRSATSPTTCVVSEHHAGQRASEDGNGASARQ